MIQTLIQFIQINSLCRRLLGTRGKALRVAGKATTLLPSQYESNAPCNFRKPTPAVCAETLVQRYRYIDCSIPWYCTLSCMAHTLQQSLMQGLSLCTIQYILPLGGTWSSKASRSKWMVSWDIMPGRLFLGNDDTGIGKLIAAYQ